MPREALHHLNLIAPEQRELFSQIRLRIGAAGLGDQALPAYPGSWAIRSIAGTVSWSPPCCTIRPAPSIRA